MEYNSPYVPPTLTVDAVIFQLNDNKLEVLLVNRQSEPFKGSWALPGGYNAEGETTLEALKRVVAKKTGVHIIDDLSYVEQLYTFDTVARDPRGHAVSVTYMGCGQGVNKHITESNVKFYPVDSLPELAYDHAEIIKYAHQRLNAKLTYTNTVYAFLPKTFTLTELQLSYEAIMGRPLDKRNFRKKIISLGLINKTDKMRRDGAYRPAHLYEFRTPSLEYLTRSLD